MSAVKPIFRELFQAVLKGFSHADLRLHQLTHNIDNHLDDLARRVDVLDGKRAEKTPVKEFDVGAFKDLKHREVVGDALQHDHIPSSAALRRARENELGRRLTPDERRALHSDAAAVELSDLLHSQSRTFRGRNTQDQVDLDAGDLRVAMEKDLRTLAKNLKADGRLTSDEIATLIQEIRDLNRKRGIG